MKTIVTLMFGILMLNQVLAANPYEKIMLENIQNIYNATSIDEYQQSINTFERIAMKETDKWEPLYYSAFGYIMMASKSKEGKKIDQYLDLAIEKVEAGLKIAPQESELVTLQGFAHMLRVNVDPATRGQQYAPLAMQTFQKAIALNPDNPRAYYLLGQMEFGTARFFNSDTKSACEKLEISVNKFQSDNSENMLAPHWGSKWAEKAAENCKE